MSVFESGAEKAKLPHGGTFNANPVTMVAGHTAMEMMTESEFKRINNLGDQFRAGIKEVLSQVNVKANILGQDSVFALEILEPSPSSETQTRGSMRHISGPEADLINEGYFISAGMHGTISTAMDEDDVAPFCDALYKALKAL
jgi:glutamate-1-semialdehyde 2,1-aminomutase